MSLIKIARLILLQEIEIRKIAYLQYLMVVPFSIGLGGWPASSVQTYLATCIDPRPLKASEQALSYDIT